MSTKRGKGFHVWNLTYGYVEHVGSAASCLEWLRNVRDLGLSLDDFEVREGSPRR